MFLRYSRLFFCGLFLSFALSGCNGGDGGDSPPQPKPQAHLIAIDVTPVSTLARGVLNEQLPVGRRAQYQATLHYSDGSTNNTKKDVAWSASNDNAVVSNDGNVKAQHTGEVTIRASLDGIDGERTLTISDATLEKLVVTQPSNDLTQGLTQWEYATGTFSDGSSVDLSEQVRWQSSDTKVASINQEGIATAHQPGTATLTATLDGQQASTELTVTDAKVTALHLSPAQASVPTGLNQSYIVSADFTDGSTKTVTTQVAWQSSNTDVASINQDGIATAHQPGTATLTATLDGQQASAELTVTDATLTSLHLSPAQSSIPAGLNQSYIVSADFTDGSTKTVTTQVAWQSSNTDVASINQDGIATAHKPGTTSLTATLDGQQASAELTVTDATLTSLHLSPAQSSIPAGLNQSYIVSADFTDGSTKTVTTQVAWQSSNTDVASINQDGIATAHKPGTTSLTATLDGQQASAELTVTAVGSVVTWGDSAHGGDSSAVQAALTGVQTVYSNDLAFAALKADGSVVTWGDSAYGGDSSAVQAALTGVRTVYSNSGAFAALKADGSVVTWGYSAYGGDSSAVQAALTGVQTVYSNNRAFAALKADGSVVTWGYSAYGGDSSAVQAALTGVQTVYSNNRAFAALKADGSVVTWGDSDYGGDSSAVQAALTGGVQAIYSNNHNAAFAALKADGSVVTWGDSAYGGDSSAVQAALTGVQTVYSNDLSFAALKADGSVVTWGGNAYGGDSSAVQAALTGVQAVYSNNWAFAALKADGSVVTWGDSAHGGDSSAVQAALTGVQAVYSNGRAFAALKADGSVVTWGDSAHGGDSSAVQAALTGVQAVYSNGWAFAALKADGSVVTWGDSAHGGDSSAVQSQLGHVQFIAHTTSAFAAVLNY